MVKAVKMLAAVSVLLFAPAAVAVEPDPSWDAMTVAIWRVFHASPNRIDRCAVPLAHEREINAQTDWPAYCNSFQATSVVQKRIAEIRELLSGLDLTADEHEMVRHGQVWIGAPALAAEFSLGRPERINRTITAGGTSEQWVYGSQTYVYITNGKVSAMQN